MAPASQQNHAGCSGGAYTLLTLWLWPGVRTGHRSCFLVLEHFTTVNPYCQPHFQISSAHPSPLLPIYIILFYFLAVQKVMHTFHLFFHIYPCKYGDKSLFSHFNST